MDLSDTHWRKHFFQLPFLNVCELLRLQQIKKVEVYFGVYKSSLTFGEKRKEILFMRSTFNFLHVGIEDANLAAKIPV